VNFQDFTLDARIQAGIQAAGYTTPTPIQAQAIPHVLKGRDVLGLAQTGTGKTAAFALPILQRLSTGPRRRVRALIISPTRELAEQTHDAFRELGRKLPLRTITVYGGVNKNRQVEALRRGAEIVVACPGRLLDIAGEGNIDLSNVEVLVLDEADRMCDMGFLPDIRRIINLVPQKRQTLFFSATMPDDIRRLSAQILHNPTTVQVDIIAPAKTVSHALYPIAGEKKKSLLMQMLEQTATGRVLIFTRTKHRARYLSRDLEKRGFHAAALQGNMSQNARQRAIDGFRRGKFDILVATDIAARGIDVAEISHVINYDMPDTVDAYTHRIGRTGRAHLTGEAFTFATPEDRSMVKDIEKVLGHPIERRQLSGFKEAAPPHVSSSRGEGPQKTSSARHSKPDNKNRKPNGPGRSRSQRAHQAQASRK